MKTNQISIKRAELKNFKSTLAAVTFLLVMFVIAVLVSACGRVSGRNQSAVVYCDTPKVSKNPVIIQDSKPAQKVYDTIHVGARGGQYVWRVSKKTGLKYKSYLSK